MGLKSIIVPTIEKEEVKTIQGVETITDQLEKEVDQLNRMIENEPKIIKGGSRNKQKRRRIKKYVRKLKEDYLPRLKKSIVNRWQRLVTATVMPKRIMMPPLCG